MLQWRIGVGWWVLVLAGLPALTLGFALLLGDTPQPVDVGPFVAAQVIGLLVNLVLINIWEETAWAGVVQTRLEQRHGLVKAALLTAVPFALIHMPLHFIGDFTIGSLVGALVALLIVCALVRLMLGVFLRGTRGSILAVAVLHTMFNRSNNDEGIVAGLVDGDGRKLAGLLAVSSSRPSSRSWSADSAPGGTRDEDHPSALAQRRGIRAERRPGPASHGGRQGRAKIPAMSVAVAGPDGVLYAGAVGYADLVHAAVPRPSTTSTPGSR